jgi:adenylosuccinate lyase
MGAVWNDENRYQNWLNVEIAVCEAQAELGNIPAKAVSMIKEKANFDIEGILEIEKNVKHDVIAFLTNVAKYIGPESRYVHLGMTSSDLLDTALALMIRQASNIIREDMLSLLDVLKNQAQKYKHTVCIGRSHGIHAEPTSFGLKFALWYDEMQRNVARFDRATEAISVGKISGAVGNYINIDPVIEQIVCKKLNLTPAKISTQIIQRDLHAEFINTIAMIGCTCEKIAVEIRHLQRTEVLEAEEPFTKGQKGSSAMPHKRNPIGTENISGLVRILRCNSIAAMENIALWHERDISHSSVERVIFPDCCIVVDFILARLEKILAGLVVYPENMIENLELTHGLIFSQAVLLALVDKGLSREKAYQLVQKNAMHCWKTQSDFKEAILSDSDIVKYLNEEEIKVCFDAKAGLKNVDIIFERLGL